MKASISLVLFSVFASALAQASTSTTCQNECMAAYTLLNSCTKEGNAPDVAQCACQPDALETLTTCANCAQDNADQFESTDIAQIAAAVNTLSGECENTELNTDAPTVALTNTAVAAVASASGIEAKNNVNAAASPSREVVEDSSAGTLKISAAVVVAGLVGMSLL